MVTRRFSLECQVSDCPTRIAVHWGSNSMQPFWVRRMCAPLDAVALWPALAW